MTDHQTNVQQLKYQFETVHELTEDQKASMKPICEEFIKREQMTP